MPGELKILFAAGIAAVLFFVHSVFSFKPPVAKAQLTIPVGGAFAPGLYDIYTPSLCGLLVTVIGPRPGVFVFFPARGIYRHFLETPAHVGVNMLGLGVQSPPCPPTLVMLGSSLTGGGM